MANPQIPQGALNRLRGSLAFDNFPSLNVTAGFLGKEAIRLEFTSEATDMLPQLAGVVTSPAPYMVVSITVNLIKTQPLSGLYKQQMEATTQMGPCTFRTDAVGFPVYSFVNCAIRGVDPITTNGENAGWVVKIIGYYQINAQLWNS